MNIPFSFEDINLIAGRYKPSTQKSYNNASFAYWARALYQRAAYAIDFTLPPEWENDLKGIFIYWLFLRGFIGIYKDPDRGVVFQPGTLSGYDFYYRPTTFIVTNPVEIDSGRSMKIGEECAIVKLAPDYGGLWDILDFYARKLAGLSLSVDVSIINTRFAKIYAARNKAAGETLKKILDLVNSGEPAVVTDEKLTDDRTDKAPPFQEFGIENLKNNYITDLQLRDMRTILNQFDNEIGISSMPYEKKERLVVNEVDSATADAVSRVTVWTETLNSCFRTVKDMFGITLSAKVRKKGEEYGERNADDPRFI